MDGTVGSYSGSSLMKDFIAVNEGETLLFSQTYVTGGDNYFRYAFYQEDTETVVTRTPNNAEKFKVTVPPGAKWLRVSYDTNNQVKIERGTKFTDWTPAPEDVEGSIKVVNTALNNFEKEVNTTFKDGVVSQAEAVAIKQHLQTVDTIKAEIDREYSTIYGNSILSSSLKSELSTNKKSYDTAHTSLKSFINTAIEDDTITTQERDSVSSAFNTYNNAVATYRATVQKCLDYVSTAKVENIQIGGTNLYKRTKVITREDWVNIGSWGTKETIDGFTVFSRTGSWMGLYQNVTFEQDETYTLSAYVKGDGVATLKYYSTGGETVISGNFNNADGTLAPTIWTRIWITFTVKNANAFGKPRFENRESNGTLELYGFKLERGNKLTDWSPSPDDMVTAENLNNQLQGLIEQSNDLSNKYQTMVSDRLVTPSEKIQLKAEYEQITDKYENAGLLVDAIDNPTLDNHYSDLTTIYNEVKALVSPLLINMTTVEEADEQSVYSKIAQFHSQYETVLRLVQTVLNSTITTVKTEVTEMATGVQTAITKSEEALGVTRTVGKHFDFTEDGWVRIYASLNGVKGSFMTQITDSRMSFYDGETEVAYISNKDLYISDARIINTLTVGNVALEKSAKGGMIFRWKG